MKPDDRFFETLAPATIAELAGLTGATVADPHTADRVIRGVCVLSDGDLRTVAFCSDRRRAADLADTRAGAVFARGDDAAFAPASCAILIAASPQEAWAGTAHRLHRVRRHPPTAPAIHPEARFEADVVIEPGVVIGPGAIIGAGTRLSAGAVVGPGVAIGRDCHVGPRAVIGFALIGDRVTILAGAIIGEPGFGAALGAGGLIDLPQLGRVILQDGVTVGAGSCIDRGAWADTVVGENTKIDNLVQIAHNVTIGRNCVLAAHTGISGSVTIGDNCQFGGRAGIADHVTIGQGARIAAAAGVMKNVPAGESWGGVPAKPVRRWMRETAWLSQMAARPKRGGEA